MPFIILSNYFSYPILSLLTSVLAQVASLSQWFFFPQLLPLLTWPGSGSCLLWTLAYDSAFGYALPFIYSNLSPPLCLQVVMPSFLTLFWHLKKNAYASSALTQAQNFAGASKPSVLNTET